MLRNTIKVQQRLFGTGNRYLLAKVRIFADMQCNMCEKEMKYYAKKDAQKNLQIVDVSRDTDLLESLHVSQSEALARLYVYHLEKQKVFVGVDAFVEIWKVLPAPWNYWAAFVENVPLVKPIGGFLYDRVFLPRIKPWLSRD